MVIQIVDIHCVSVFEPKRFDHWQSVWCLSIVVNRGLDLHDS